MSVSWKRSQVWYCVAVLVLFSAPVETQLPAQMAVPQIVNVRLIGYLGTWRSHGGTTDLTLGHGADIYHFQLQRLRVLAGEENPSDILADIAPYYPNLILQGNEDQILQLAWAKPGQHIEITGTLRVGSQQLRVTDIAIRPQIEGGTSGADNSLQPPRPRRILKARHGRC
jgi:hypothetical protein